MQPSAIATLLKSRVEPSGNLLKKQGELRAWSQKKISAGQTAAWGRLVGRHRVQKRSKARQNRAFETRSSFRFSLYAAPIGAAVVYAVYVNPSTRAVHAGVSQIAYGRTGYCGLGRRGLAILRSAVLITLYLLLTWGVFVDGVVTTTGYTILGVAGLVVLGLSLWLFCAKGPDGGPPYLSHTVDGFMHKKAVDNDMPAGLKEELLGHLGSAIRLVRDT